MNIKDYFLNATKAKAYEIPAWHLGVFTQIIEDEDEWLKDPYPYRIVQQRLGTYFVDPNKNGELTKLDIPAGQAPLKWSDQLDLRPGDYSNVKENITTTYGNAIYNCVIVMYAFSGKIPFHVGTLNIKKYEEQHIKPRFKDGNSKDHEVGADPFQDFIYVDEYLRYHEGWQMLSDMSLIGVPTLSKRSMTTHPEMKKLRAKLIKEHEHELDDPVVVVNIIEQLMRLDDEWLEGDSSQGFLTKKIKETIRTKLYMIGGFSAGFEAGKWDLIIDSLDEGWRLEEFKTFVDSFRVGAFNRGAATQLGGEFVKWFARVTGSVEIKPGDCGTKEGIPYVVTKDNYKSVLGHHLLNTSGPAISEGNYESFLGKEIYLRSPLRCLQPDGNYCEVCIGERLAKNPERIVTAVMDDGDRFLYMFMKKVHAGALKTARLDINQHSY